MRMVRLRAAIAGTLALGLSFAPIPSIADGYPTQAVRVFIGSASGGPADLTARVLSRRLSQTLGQPFSVETRRAPGSDSAADVVARAPKDGYTLLVATTGLAISAGLAGDPVPDFTPGFAPVVLIASVPQVLVVSPSLGVSNVRDLIGMAKAHPGQLSFGSGGTGTATHLAGELFNLMADVRLAHVPYPGVPQAVTDLQAGRISAMFAPASAVLQQIEQGKLKALATTGARRAGITPNVPTMAEAGLTGYEAGLWFGLLAPVGTPLDVIDRLATAINAALQAHDVRSALRVQGIDAVGGSPQDFAQHLESETRKWAKVAVAAGLKKSLSP